MKTPVIRNFAERHKGRLLSFADQGMLGLSAFSINILIARYFSDTTFAIVSVMMGLHYLVFGVHRGVVVLPYILEEGGASGAAAAEAQSAWWTINLVFVGAIASLLGFAASILKVTGLSGPQLTWIVDAVFLLALTTPPLLLFEYARRALYQGGATSKVAICSTAYFIAGTVTVSAGVAAGSAILSGLAFAVAGAAGTAVFIVSKRPSGARLSTALATWKRQSGFGAWQAMTSIPYNLYAISPVVLVGAFAGPTAAAVFGVGRTIASPAFSIVSAVDSMDKPRAVSAMAQAGLKGLHGSISRTRKLILALAGGYLVLVILFAPWATKAAFGPEYANDVGAIRLVALAFLFLCLNQPVETMLIVLRRVRVMFVIRLVAALAIVGGIFMGANVAGVFGVALATAGVQSAVLLTLTLIELRIVKQSRERPGNQ